MSPSLKLTEVLVSIHDVDIDRPHTGLTTDSWISVNPGRPPGRDAGRLRVGRAHEGGRTRARIRPPGHAGGCARLWLVMAAGGWECPGRTCKSQTRGEQECDDESEITYGGAAGGA